MSEAKGLNPLVAAELAHEIRNVFTIVRTSAIILREAIPACEGAGAILDDLIGASDRAAELSHRLMAHARAVEPGEPTPLGQVVAHHAETLRRLAPANVEVHVEADESLVATIPVRDIQLVLVNLAHNAFDAMPEGGSLVIRVARVTDERAANAPDLVAWSVADSGVGMDEATRGRCFAAFFTTKPTGTGLGLHAVREVIERHAGRIAIASAPGHGTTFTMLLPRG